MSVPLPLDERLLCGVGSVAALAACAWLAWAEWGAPAGAHPAGRTRPPSDLLAEARTASEDEHWAAALRALEQLPVDGEPAEEGAELRARATMELRNQAAFLELQRHLVDDRPTAARKSLKRIPQDSIYRERAERLLKRLE